MVIATSSSQSPICAAKSRDACGKNRDQVVTQPAAPEADPPPAPIRYYRFGPFTVDTEAPVLTTASGATTLEPRVHDLLVLFCRHAGRVVTRDEILTEVWRGGIVSDNAVNKLVARLRQALKDDSRAPSYIQTVSRRGYRLSATVVPDTDDRPAVEQRQRRAGLRWVLAVPLGALLAWLALTRLPGGNDAAGPLPVRPLTRHSGSELAAAISPDGRFLAYTRQETARSQRELWIEDLVHGTRGRVELAGIVGHLLRWAPDSRHLAVLSLVDDACRVRSLFFDDSGAVAGATELLSCDGRSVNDVIFSPGGDRLYYTSRERPFQPMQILVQELAGGATSLLTQPPLRGAGNYAIDLSPRGDKLLILSADETYRSQLHVLTVATGALTDHARFDHFVDEAVWHHDNESVVHLAAPLAYELVRSSLAGEAMETVVSTSSRIIHFARHPNGLDFYFASFQMDNDLLHVMPSTGEAIALDNTAVYEHLPSASARSNRYLYLSNRSGRTQTYLGELGEAGSRQLTHFGDSRLFVALALSPDDSRFVLATYNELLIASAESGEIVRETRTDGLILSAGWLAADRLAVSRLVDDQPRLVVYDIQVDVFQAAPLRWAGAAADLTTSAPIYYAIDPQGTVYRTDAALTDAVDTGLRLPDAFLQTGLNLKAANGLLYYQRNDKLQSTIVQYDPQIGESRALGTWDYVAGFDVSPSGLILSHEVGRMGDVVTTAGGR